VPKILDIFHPRYVSAGTQDMDTKSELIWPVSPPVGCYRLHLRSPFICITHPKRWYSFYCPI